MCVEFQLFIHLLYYIVIMVGVVLMTSLNLLMKRQVCIIFIILLPFLFPKALMLVLRLLPVM